jgi:hypothetical protein
MFRAALALCLICISLLGPGLTRAEDRRVTTPAELLRALEEMPGGVILLAPGAYGALLVERRHTEKPIALRSELPRQAVFDQVSIKNSQDIAFEGLATRGIFRVEKSAGITVTDCDARNTLYFRDVDRLRIDNCVVLGGQFGVLFNSVTNFEIRHSRIGQVSEDVMRITGNSSGGLVEENFLDDVIAYPPTHPDLIQLFGAKGATPHHIIIRRNFLRDLHETGSPKRTAQGIFVSDPQKGGYHDILIEENIIMTRSGNTIYINGGQKNVVVRANTLLSSAGDGGAIIRLARKAQLKNSGTVVENNIAKLILDETRSSYVRSNYLYGRGAKITGIFSGTGKRWQDFLPVLGTGPDKPGMGATDFLRDLLAAQKPGAKGGPQLGPDWSE